MSTTILIMTLVVMATTSGTPSAMSETNVTFTLTLAPSPCHVDTDPVYKGFRVDCQHKSISFLPLPDHWIPEGTSTLLLGYNSISQLTCEMFSPVWLYNDSLRCLSLTSNRISSVDKATFSRLSLLQKIDLSNNKINLDQKSLDGQVFDGLEHLAELRLDSNNNGKDQGLYNDSLFNDLRELCFLTLDTFSGDLNFGGIFQNTHKLSSLSITGGFTRLTNNSFKAFYSINLTKLIIFGDYLVDIESASFQPLNSLDWLDIGGSSKNLQLFVTLESLAPFVQRNMSHITLHDMVIPGAQHGAFRQNSIVTRHMTRYLSNICLEQFAMVRILVLIVETGAFSTPMWRKCLKYLELSNLPLIGEKQELWRLMTSHTLEYIKFVDRKYYWSHNHNTIWIPPKCVTGPHKPLSHWHPTEVNARPMRNTYTTPCHIDKKINISPKVDESKMSISDIKVSPSIEESDSTISVRTSPDVDEFNLAVIIGQNIHTFQTSPSRSRSELILRDHVALNLNSSCIFYLARNMKFLILNAFSYNIMPLTKRFHLANADNLIELHMADDGISQFIGPIVGLKNLKLLDISLNDGSIMSSEFFDSLSSVVYLNMASMRLNDNFMANHSRRLFHNLSQLTTLILSDNDLHYLSEGTFANNLNLSYLNFKGNRFPAIPFDLVRVPKLCHLDMRVNSLRTLSEQDITSLENHFKIMDSFSIHLAGNEFLCNCNNIRFLAWLQRTRINLDSERNYSCLTISGIKSSTNQMKDLDALWRQCKGQKAFWIAIYWLSFMTLVYGCCLVLPKFKTQLKAFVLKTFWAPMMMKTATDYPIGVYIGYADQEIDLACHRLRPFIEERLHLTTYVRHRDLLPASDMAQSIMEAIHSSWRVLLLVSGHFLRDEWSYYALKAATFSGQADNPWRLVLVLVLHDTNDRFILSKLPNSVLQAVKEENIIYITSTGRISYEDKQALKSALHH